MASGTFTVLIVGLAAILGLVSAILFIVLNSKLTDEVKTANKWLIWSGIGTGIAAAVFAIIGAIVIMMPPVNSATTTIRRAL